MVLYYLQKVTGKSDWKVNGTILFESFQWEISGSKGMSEKGSHVLAGRNLPDGNSCFISSKPTLIPSFAYALAAVFRQIELICANNIRDSRTKFTNPKFCLSFALTNCEPIGQW